MSSQETTIHGWIARDIDGQLGLFYDSKEPEMRGCCDYHFTLGKVLHLPKDIFLELKWSDKPVEVELTIKRKKNVTLDSCKRLICTADFNIEVEEDLIAGPIYYDNTIKQGDIFEKRADGNFECNDYVFSLSDIPQDKVAVLD